MVISYISIPACYGRTHPPPMLVSVTSIAELENRNFGEGWLEFNDTYSTVRL